MSTIPGTVSVRVVTTRTKLPVTSEVARMEGLATRRIHDLVYAIVAVEDIDMFKNRVYTWAMQNNCEVDILL